MNKFHNIIYSPQSLNFTSSLATRARKQDATTKSKNLAIVSGTNDQQQHFVFSAPTRSGIENERIVFISDANDSLF